MVPTLKRSCLLSAFGAAVAMACSLGPTVAQAVDPIPIVYSANAEACHVIKAAPGALTSLGGYAGQAEFVMLFNATAPPGDGAVNPSWWGYAGTSGAWSAAWLTPAAFNVGITACYSSTGPFTKAAVSTGNTFSAQVQ